MKYKSVNSLQNSPRYFKLQFKTIEFSLKKRFSNWGVTVTVWRHFFVLSGLKISKQLWGYYKNFIAVYLQFQLLLQKHLSRKTTQ